MLCDRPDKNKNNASVTSINTGTGTQKVMLRNTVMQSMSALGTRLANSYSSNYLSKSGEDD